MSRCRECGEAEMTSTTPELCHYTESGLPNVWGHGIEIRTCPKCGDTLRVVPRMGELHRVIAMAVLHKQARLSATEVRFLRKHLGYSGEDFARRVGVDRSTVSRWENDKEGIGAGSDRTLRLLVARHEPIESYPDEELEKISNEAAPPVRVKANRRGQHWSAEAAPS